MSDDRPHHLGPLQWMAGCWLAGGVLSTCVGLAWLLPWAVIGTAVTCVLAVRGRRRGSWCWGLLAMVGVAGAWTIVGSDRAGPGDLGRLVSGDESQLVEVEGVVESAPRLRAAQRGAFAHFAHEPPATHLVLGVRRVTAHGAPQPASGRLLVRVAGADPRLRYGDTIRARGWLSSLQGPMNPGERDYREVLAYSGIVGRLTLNNRGNWQLLAPAGGLARLQALRQRLSAGASASLRLGMQADTALHGQRLAFLDTLLLGLRRGDLGGLDEAFRQTGLAHLLSISGAHMGILLGLVWLLVRAIDPNPSRATLTVMIVLVLYMLALPWQVPVVRAGLMAGVFCLGQWWGKRLRGLDALALALLLVLVWRPGDLFAAGFQLSFGVVAGLLLFTRPVSLKLAPLALAEQWNDRPWGTWLRRWSADLLAANIVATAVALPLVAYHFQMVSPMALLLSLLALPGVTVTLGLGYLKIVAGAVLPSAGLLLARPLEWVTDSMTALVRHAATWPGASLQLVAAPSLLWTIGATAVMVALLAGWYARRRGALAVSLSVCVLWLALPGAGTLLRERDAGDPALRVNMFAVGNGSCYLLRLPPAAGERDGHVIMFDCGSEGYLDVGATTIGPALQRLGVPRIDTLMLSHADLDHFGGTLDLLDQVEVGRVLVTPQMLAEAAENPREAVAFLIEQLRARGVTLEVVSRGWSQRLGDAEAQLLWPPPKLRTRQGNDVTMLLSLRMAGRRMLMCGDLQQLSLSALLESGVDLKADVCELPHHGSFAPASLDFIDAVGPSVVLQSCGRTRMLRDRWADVLRQRGIHRMATVERGMVELRIARDGRITSECFREK